jgi:hypothetical protein
MATASGYGVLIPSISGEPDVRLEAGPRKSEAPRAPPLLAPLTPREIASGVATGSTGARPDPEWSKAIDPVAALERSVEVALRRPPCLVSFSGGHDSSLVLAAATRVAQRERLDPPIPVTWRIRGAPRAEESAWQDEVVGALGLADWIRLTADDDLDLVGPVAADVLSRHGLLYPANAHLHAPLLAQAAGGALLTGVGGDQVLGRLPRPRRPWWYPNAGATAPFGWLRPAARRRVRAALRREARARPPDYAGRPDWAATRRDLALTRRSLALLGGDTDTAVFHPLLDPAVMRALVGSGFSPADAGRAGLLGRIFGGVYPDAVLRARPKAWFGEVFWRRPTRERIGAWDGGGIDTSVVSPAELRREWARPHPDLHTAMLVQRIWCADHPPASRR